MTKRKEETMDWKQIVGRVIVGVIVGAVLGIAGTFFAFQGRVSTIETEIDHLKTEIDHLKNATAPLAVSPTTTPAQVVDTRCRGREPGAVIDGNPVPLSDWQSDCSYSEVLNGQKVELTTWGFILEYGGSTIASARIVAPCVTVTAPPNSVLFAGYLSRESVEAAYRTVSPNGPTPIP
jgi:hypothetical protein